MNKYFSRVTSSARGEKFNFLLWPFLLATFAYGVGFALIMPFTTAAGDSSLYHSMHNLGSGIPVVWGAVALFVILTGLTFLLFNIPPFGKLSGLVGFILWTFGGMCYVLSHDYLTLFSVAIPNMVFWIWQYLSLSDFRKQDADDQITIDRYNRR